MNRTLRYPHQFLGLNLQDCHPHRSVVMKMMMRWIPLFGRRSGRWWLAYMVFQPSNQWFDLLHGWLDFLGFFGSLVLLGTVSFWTANITLDNWPQRHYDTRPGGARRLHTKVFLVDHLLSKLTSYPQFWIKRIMTNWSANLVIFRTITWAWCNWSHGSLLQLTYNLVLIVNLLDQRINKGSLLILFLVQVFICPDKFSHSPLKHGHLFLGLHSQPLISSTSLDALFTTDWTSVAALLWVSPTTFWASWWIWLTNWEASILALALSCSKGVSASLWTWPTTVPANCKASCLVRSTIWLASARIKGSTHCEQKLHFVAYLHLNPDQTPCPVATRRLGFLEAGMDLMAS